MFRTPESERFRAVESWLMKSKMKIWFPLSIALAFMGVSCMAGAQAPSRVVGTIAAIDGNTLSVKTDQGQAVQVVVPTTATLKRIAPGEKDLSKAETIQFSDLAVGDRALVKLDPSAPAGISQALQIVAIKQSDLAQKQQKDREDWQLRGVGGLVKSVDAAAGVIVLTSGSGATAKTITVHTTKATVLKRYAPASVSFDSAQLAPIDAIHMGDQLRARGTKNADGTEIAAEEVVSGTFRNISGTIASIDTTGSTLLVKDLATKKQVTIHITADAQMRRLPDRMAQMLAARLKGSPSASQGGGGGTAAPASAGTAPAPQHGGQGQWGGSGGQGGGQWGGQNGGASSGGGQWAGRGGGDPQQMLSRAPAIQLGDLQKGEAVMLVSTDGTTEVTAITLLAGVEPLLEAPAASRDLLANWSVGANTPDVAQ
jgi:uncharacterized membrane protein YgcG